MADSLMRFIVSRLEHLPLGRPVNPNDEPPGDHDPGTFRFLGHFLKVVYKESMRDMIPIRSASLTYATMLTLVPILIIVFNLFQIFGGADWFAETIRPFILANLAPGTGEQVAARIEEIVTQAGSFALNGIGVLLLVIAVWSIFSGIEGTVNYIWGTRSKAGSLKRVPLYWGLITILPILLVGSLAISTYIQAMPIISTTVEHFGFAERLFNRGVAAGLIVLGLYLLYQFVPNTRVRRRFALASAIICGLLYEILKSIFIYYSTNLVQYNLLYGSLGVIVLLLIWVNLSWVLILLGVEMTYVQQHYHTISVQSKRLKLSQTQERAIAYLLLYEVTHRFNRKDSHSRVHPAIWADDQGLPPGLAEQAAEALELGGFVERVTPNGDQIMLARSPESIQLEDIERVLNEETLAEWEWPALPHWQWIRLWLKRRRQAAMAADKLATLADFIHIIDRTLEEANLRRKGASRPENEDSEQENTGSQEVDAPVRPEDENGRDRAASPDPERSRKQAGKT